MTNISGKRQILIVQNMIPHYRKPLYNELSKYYDVTVMHSGSNSCRHGDNYKEIITPFRKFGSFYVQSGLLREIQTGKYDVVIVMFDIRWVANVFAALLKRNSRFIYWGHRYSNNPLINIARDVLMRKAPSRNYSLPFCRHT